MLDVFLTTNREAIIAGARARISSRKSPRPTNEELSHGIPVYLDQLGDALRLAKSSDVPDRAELGKNAGRHGGDLFRMGLTIGQVVTDYGDVCQSITSLAISMKSPIDADEFRQLNLCLDDAIAGAVTEWTSQRERSIRGQGIELLGVLAHELRNLLNSAVLAYDSMKRGQVAIGGATGQVLGRSLLGMAGLIDRSLADVRLDAGIEHVEQISVADFLGEVEIAAALHANVRGIHLLVASVSPAVIIEGDRQVLAAAIANLLQNAFKFSHEGATVALTTRVTEEQVLFDIEDECGGLPPGNIETLFAPFSQRGKDRSGVGLGLSISVRAATVSGGQMSVRDLPGKGCVFTLSLPRKPLHLSPS
jgi:signal transduction histidine kinase